MIRNKEELRNKKKKLLEYYKNRTNIRYDKLIVRHKNTEALGNEKTEKNFWMVFICK